MKVKYAIETLKKICMAEGAMGKKMAVDVTYNCFVNTRGRGLVSKYTCDSRKVTFFLPGEPHSNIPADLHMEHCNKQAIEDVSSAKGPFSFLNDL